MTQTVNWRYCDVAIVGVDVVLDFVDIDIRLVDIGLAFNWWIGSKYAGADLDPVLADPNPPIRNRTRNLKFATLQKNRILMLSLILIYGPRMDEKKIFHLV